MLMLAVRGQREKREEGRAKRIEIRSQRSEIRGRTRRKPLGYQVIVISYQLKDEGYKAFHAALICRVLVGKLLEHEFFLVAQLGPYTHQHQWQRDDSGDVPEHDHGGDEHDQEPGVKRMAHQRVWPARNQFVAAF